MGNPHNRDRVHWHVPVGHVGVLENPSVSNRFEGEDERNRDARQLIVGSLIALLAMLMLWRKRIR